MYHDRWGAHASHGGIYLAFSTDGGATRGEPGVRLERDPYTGGRAKAYACHVHRSGKPSFGAGPENRIGSVSGAARYDDAGLVAGKVYYRVAAFEGGKRIGTSWVVAARAGG